MATVTKIAGGAFDGKTLSENLPRGSVFESFDKNEIMRLDKDSKVYAEVKSQLENGVNRYDIQKELKDAIFKVKGGSVSKKTAYDKWADTLIMRVIWENPSLKKKLYGFSDQLEQEQEQKQEENQKKRSGGGCSGNSSQSDSSSDSSDSESDQSNEESENKDEKQDDKESSEDLADQVNSMCKKTYTVFRPIHRESACPTSRRDNMGDQITPQDDLLTAEKTVRDFLKLEGKIYDIETDNPKFFASEQWIQTYEKDKNTVLSLFDQFKANILRMQHLYNVVDNNSYSKLCSIPNQDCKSSFQTNILWTARSLKDFSSTWFIKRNCDSSTQRFDQDFWLPGLTGQMVQWMKLGSYCEYEPTNPAIEQMIARVDRLEAVIDRLMNKEAVDKTISKYVSMKETLEKKADQKKNEAVFTSKVIDTTMGEKLGVTKTGVENHKIEGTVTRPPKSDDVESVLFQCKASCVKKLFKQLRDSAMETLESCRCVSCSGPGPFPQIWTNIDTLAEPVYRNIEVMNDLITDAFQDHESPGAHCNITHVPIDTAKLRLQVTSFKGIIETGVTDVITNQAMLPKKGLNILDSLFNNVWELSEKGPLIEMPSWCQEAITSIEGFERNMADAWNHVFMCWLREFTTRLWNVETDHHSGTWERTQLESVQTQHNHIHPFVPLTMLTQASVGGDTDNLDITPLKGVFTCEGHLEKLMGPVCMQYRICNISHLSRHYLSDLKALCQWLTCAIQAIGIRQASISIAMSDPTLNGECGNEGVLKLINGLKKSNNQILDTIEEAYGIYSDIDNMKEKKKYDDEIALQELQPNKYSNEDQLNMTSSLQTETRSLDFGSQISAVGVINELKPWNHLNLNPRTKQPEKIPVVPHCNKFEKIVKTLAGFESAMNIE